MLGFWDWVIRESGIVDADMICEVVDWIVVKGLQFLLLSR
jgi:hypothetical protein